MPPNDRLPLLATRELAEKREQVQSLETEGRMEMQADGNRIDLKELLSGAQLPALPQSATRLLKLSQDPENGPAEFAVPIEADPGLTGQVLRFVNSSYFGFRQEISSVKLAISLVGIRTIKNFALWSAVFSLLPNPKCGPFDLKRLWQDSLRRGIFARSFGKIIGLAEAEDLFATALLQDMAIPLLAKELPADYQQMLDARQDGAHRLSDLERERFGWTHAEAGGELARGWGLPESFASTVQAHIHLAQIGSSERSNGSADAIILSSMLPSVCDHVWSEREAFTTLYLRLAGQKASPLGEVFGRIDAEFTEFAPVLKLATPAKALIESLSEYQPASI
jgi:HD-like signal output (HDOD) protein